ncbi:hypothetical protein GCM10010191_89280 [Actinomadura vinacea]|uniref:Uncharacterized protein n=1 Tax=Actinomadura vinacea TaxID=115336 RepID=A0ABN3KCR9_9ACTN
MVDRLRAESEDDPDIDGVTIRTEHGTVGIRAFRPGITDPAYAWIGNLDWAALIIYLPTDSAEIYIIPGAHFTQCAFRANGVLQHVDHQDADHPGVYWTDLTGDAYDQRFTRLAPYRVT